MKAFFKKIFIENQKIRKFTGVTLIIIGLISIITPFTPVGFLLIIGMEILGVRMAFWEKIKKWFRREKTVDNLN